MPNEKRFDLEERTARFGENIILLSQKINLTPITEPIIKQHKISISRKESKECKHHLRMIATAVPQFKQEIKKLWQEAHELNLIFISIVKKSKQNAIIKN